MNRWSWGRCWSNNWGQRKSIGVPILFIALNILPIRTSWLTCGGKEKGSGIQFGSHTGLHLLSFPTNPENTVVVLVGWNAFHSILPFVNSSHPKTMFERGSTVVIREPGLTRDTRPFQLVTLAAHLTCFFTNGSLFGMRSTVVTPMFLDFSALMSTVLIPNPCHALTCRHDCWGGSSGGGGGDNDRFGSM